MGQWGSIPVAPDETTALCAVAAATAGETRLEIASTQLRWRGEGVAAWDIEVQEPGEYDVALCCACVAEGAAASVSSGSSGSGLTLPRTRGCFLEPNGMLNFERVGLGETIRLGPGSGRIELKVRPPAGEPRVAVSSLELTPASARRAVGSSRDRAVAARPPGDLLSRGGYGLMFHWTSQSKPRTGPAAAYRDAVEAFDVGSFASMVTDTGAKWVFLTANHAEPTFPAPLRSWERLYPGRTTRRDLVAEMAGALAERGVAMMLYLNTFAAYIRSPRLRNTDGSSAFADNRRIHASCRGDYLATTCELLGEIGERYGESLRGYWFDSWYQPFMHFGTFPMEQVYRAARTGNPGRLIAFNWWILPLGTAWNDYWAGEVGGIVAPASGRVFDHGPAKGFPYHALLIMDDPWVHGEPDKEVAPPLHTPEALGAYIRSCEAHGGAVTVNLGIYQDGSVGERSLDVMRGVRKIARGA